MRFLMVRPCSGLLILESECVCYKEVRRENILAGNMSRLWLVFTWEPMMMAKRRRLGRQESN
jgi:hypothetical protein